MNHTMGFDSVAVTQLLQRMTSYINSSKRNSKSKTQPQRYSLIKHSRLTAHRLSNRGGRPPLGRVLLALGLQWPFHKIKEIFSAHVFTRTSKIYRAGHPLLEK